MRTSPTVVLSIGSLLWAARVEAHIQLNTPTARYVQDNNGLKTAPCGSGTRSGAVTKVAVGQSLTVTWKESVSHAGHFRIALSAKESDFADPSSLTVPNPLPAWDLVDGIADKTGTQTYSQTVQLPAVECPACVLQVIQVMSTGTDGTNTGSFSGVYHACADLAITGGGSDAGWVQDAMRASDAREEAGLRDSRDPDNVEHDAGAAAGGARGDVGATGGVGSGGAGGVTGREAGGASGKGGEPAGVGGDLGRGGNAGAGGQSGGGAEAGSGGDAVTATGSGGRTGGRTGPLGSGGAATGAGGSKDGGGGAGSHGGSVAGTSAGQGGAGMGGGGAGRAVDSPSAADGCSCRLAKSPRSMSWWPGLALAVLWLRWRRLRAGARPAACLLRVASAAGQQERQSQDRNGRRRLGGLP
jgi:hypothetical protein